MKAAVLQQDQLTHSEQNQPVPGEYEVLVQVKAVSLNYRDILVTRGVYGGKNPDNLIPCSDGAGVVVAIGKQVSRVQVGDRVMGTFFQNWLSGRFKPEYGASALGGAINGMLAEYVVLNENGLVQTPAHLSDEEAATLPCAALTAWNALVEQCQVRPGESVLLQGTGGVSMFALQLAKMMGLKVYMTSSSDQKLARLKEMGADAVFNYKTNPNWSQELLSQTGGHGVNHVVEVGGSATLNQSIELCATSGHIAMIGVLTGVQGEINTGAILHKSLHIHGIYVGSRDMFEAMCQALSVNRIQPVIDRVFSFQESAAALEYLQSGQHFGKVVIRL